MPLEDSYNYTVSCKSNIVVKRRLSEIKMKQWKYLFNYYGIRNKYSQMCLSFYEGLDFTVQSNCKYAVFSKL